jgi:hypothetical protein
MGASTRSLIVSLESPIKHLRHSFSWRFIRSGEAARGDLGVPVGDLKLSPPLSLRSGGFHLPVFASAASSAPVNQRYLLGRIGRLLYYMI